MSSFRVRGLRPETPVIIDPNINDEEGESVEYDSLDFADFLEEITEDEYMESYEAEDEFDLDDDN